MMKTEILYIALAANVIAVIQMAIDKRRAIKQKNRIPEAQLIAPTLFGGFPGILLGMIFFRHKTQKRSFQLKLGAAVLIFVGVTFLVLQFLTV